MQENQKMEGKKKNFQLLMENANIVNGIKRACISKIEDAKILTILQFTQTFYPKDVLRT